MDNTTPPNDKTTSADIVSITTRFNRQLGVMREVLGELNDCARKGRAAAGAAADAKVDAASPDAVSADAVSEAARVNPLIAPTAAETAQRVADYLEVFAFAARNLTDRAAAERVGPGLALALRIASAALRVHAPQTAKPRRSR